MRKRGVRVFSLIAVVVAISLAVLSVGDISFSRFGLDLDVSGDGPLGLTLGLDLKGGSLLIYQADVPDEALVTFEETVEESDLRELLDDLGHAEPTLSMEKFAIEGLLFEVVAQLNLRGAFQQSSFSVETLEFEDGTLIVAFEDLSIPGEEATPVPPQPELLSFMAALGYGEATIVVSGDNTYIFDKVTFVERAQQDLDQVLRVLSPIEELTFDDGSLDVTFVRALEEADIRSILDRSGYSAAVVTVPPQENYIIGNLVLDERTGEELRDALDELAPVESESYITLINDPTIEDMQGVKEIIERRVNAIGTTEPIVQTLGDDRLVVQLPGADSSTIELAFQSVPGREELQPVLFGLRRTGDSVEPGTTPNSYVIRGEEPFEQAEVDRIAAQFAEILVPTETFELSEDAQQIELSFTEPPGESAIRDNLEKLEITSFTLDTTGSDSYIIVTDDPVPTVDQETFREALEAEGAQIRVFEARGGFEEAKGLIQQTAQLVFRERTCLDLASDPTCTLLLTDTDIGTDGLTGKDLSGAFRSRNPTTNEPEVNVQFNSRGTGLFRELTRLIAGQENKRIAIFLDEELLAAPVVNSPIVDGLGRITGGFSNESARLLAIQLESGRLPVPLNLIRENTVDALLGADSLRKSLIAGLVGLGLVMAFMLAYYRLAGLVAATSLLIYAVILLAIFKLAEITLVLSGLAGIVLSVGMAVDANILISERMKEELRSGRSMTSAMEVGFRRAWRAIRDSNVSTIITCLILFLFGSRLGGGTPVVTGFAVTLLIGVLVSMFTAYTVSRNLLQLMALTPMGKKIYLFSPEPRRQPVGVAGGGK